MTKKTVLRVGVYNNFNFTNIELDEVVKFSEQGYFPFVNSNSFVTISPEFPSIATINPYLNSWQAPEGDLSNLKACRVKWVAGANSEVFKAQTEAVTWCLDRAIPVLVTFMRFVSKRSLSNFVTESSSCRYSYTKSFYRLIDVAAEFNMIRSQAGDRCALIYGCDVAGMGCPSCGNCARLTYGFEPDEADVASLSLSCSGDDGKCIFHCPDCWAHRLSRIAKFKFDQVTFNNKQKGHEGI